MDAAKKDEIFSLFKNKENVKKLETITDEAGLKAFLAEHGISVTDDEITELFTISESAAREAKKIYETASKLEALLKNPECADEFVKLDSDEKIEAFNKKYGVEITGGYVAVSQLVAMNKDVEELTEEDLEQVVGGSFWSVFKEVVAWVPVVGTLGKTVCDLADGSLRGAGNIAARFGVVAVSGLLDAVGTIGSFGALSIAKSAIMGATKGLAGRAVVSAGLLALSNGTKMAVDAAL